MFLWKNLHELGIFQLAMSDYRRVVQNIWEIWRKGLGAGYMSTLRFEWYRYPIQPHDNFYTCISQNNATSFLKTDMILYGFGLSTGNIFFLTGWWWWSLDLSGHCWTKKLWVPRTASFTLDGTADTGWWSETCFIFPYIGNNHSNWKIFFRWVETTKQDRMLEYISDKMPNGMPGRMSEYMSGRMPDIMM